MAMFNPASTYRIQFHKGFNFNDFEKIIPYLVKLGISTLYASPVFEAVPGSMHGYDTVNPLNINPEIGTLEQLKGISKKLKANGIGWLQDIVPNHMAFNASNAWLTDVLEKGPLSAFKNYFDQSLANNFYNGPIMVPFLGNTLDEVIENGELAIIYQRGGLFFKYFDDTWPLQLGSYRTVFSARKPKPDEPIKAIISLIKRVQLLKNPADYAGGFEQIREQVALITDFLNDRLPVVNQDKKLIKAIAGEQFYRLCSWKETDSDINFRRFFTVNSLICLNIQRTEVFDHFHRLIGELCAEGIFQGLRIDHIDGLYNPDQYLQDLRRLAGDEVYIVVEKILEPGELLPARWPVEGSTGYDYLALVNNLFTSNKDREGFTRFYHRFTGNDKPVEEQIEDKKAYVLANHMAGELDNLTRLFLNSGIAEQKKLNDIPAAYIREVIGKFLVKCPVYRYYPDQVPFSDKDRPGMKAIFNGIKKDNGKLADAVDLLAGVFLEAPEGDEPEHTEKTLNFYRRCMQFSGPLMAKGVEDTLMYTYNRFINHNEVGDSPGAFGITAEEFHRQMQWRQANWPLSVNGTSTHDTKRGEGVRSRLNALSDMGDEWPNKAKAWQEMNADLKASGTPDNNDELFIYQTLIGSYPMPGEGDDDYGDRISDYLEKALREGKQHTDWAGPNQAYEDAAKQFAAGLLKKDRPFWSDFQLFHRRLADFGILNSLAQLLLKFTCPGVPDIYQGCENWDLSLVDPDNRRLVDYKLHEKLLRKIPLPDGGDAIGQMWQNRYDGQIKIWLTHTLLQERKANANHFKQADYLPLKVSGSYKQFVLAFARPLRGNWYIIAVPLNAARLCRAAQAAEVWDIDWKDTLIELPQHAPSNCTDLLCCKTARLEKQIAVQSLFKNLPLALLRLEQPVTSRSSGVLLPIFSLPSAFGIGDLGPEAKHFADILVRCEQKIWQMLPLNPVEPQNQYSPYSSCSAMAGNTLFISPELLVDDGLADKSALSKYFIKTRSKVDYAAAQGTKANLLQTAWRNFKSAPAPWLQASFEKFCRAEAYWLNNYALYCRLKEQFDNKPWHQWPDEFKLRNQQAIDQFTKKHQDLLQKTKWLQFIFSRQWKELKSYCNEKGIQLFGDLPFYLSYDSADVWAYPEIFSLDKNLDMKTIAGVPPDYFNADGQLWGMPVFCWDKLKEQNYSWWVNRIRRNMELFDLLRLDHFRAFSSYWAVPAGEKTAVNGSWEKGPGKHFFNTLKKEFGKLPFVAEDLGDIDDEVYKLRDAFGLPGMKVLQFSFGEDMPHSPHIPHNYTPNHIAYTGTHDNNTTRGWYKEEMGATGRHNITNYTGKKLGDGEVSHEFIRIIMASVAKTAIIPIQDLLQLDEESRVNTPAGTENNWIWRLKPRETKKIPEEKLAEWTRLYNRS